MYEYKANVLRVVDGDTVDLDIHLGFGVKIKQRVRLSGINTPETRTKDLDEKKKGLAAKDRLIELIGETCEVHTSLDKKGKYGRVLGVIFADDININYRLIQEGHAVEYNG